MAAASDYNLYVFMFCCVLQGCISNTLYQLLCLRIFAQLVLLIHAEKRLVTLCQDTPSGESALELRVRAYLGLVSIAQALHHSKSAIQLCLATLRLMQCSSSDEQPRFCEMQYI